MTLDEVTTPPAAAGAVPLPHPLPSLLRDPALARFVAAGAVSTALGFVLFHAFHALYGDAPGAAGLAQASTYLVGTGVMFLVSRAWTFRSGGAARRELPRFVAAHAAALALSSVGVDVGVTYLGVHPTRCWLVVMAATTACSYLLQRHWVFRAR